MEISSEQINPIGTSSIDEHFPPYESYDKKTLLVLLVRKDSALQQTAEEKNRLLRELEVLKESNQTLISEIEELRFQLNAYSISNKDDKQLNDKQLSTGEEHGSKPMPDWRGDGTNSTNDCLASISDIVRATAEAELKSLEPDHANAGEEDSEYVFDSSSGYYYHPSTGYYWDPNSKLFYDYTSGTYYRFNEANGQYEIHSQVDNLLSGSYEIDKKKCGKISAISKSAYSKTLTSMKKADEGKKKLKKKKRKKTLKKRDSTADNDDSIEDMDVDCKDGAAVNDSDVNMSDDGSSGSLATGESELESGEITSSDSSDVELNEEGSSFICASEKLLTLNEYESSAFNTSEEQLYPEAIADNYPPCIRAIIQESEKLCFGTLFIITCTGGSIGRDAAAKHCMHIPDIGVSKTHARIEYDYDDSCYKVADLGSQNGTRINGRRLTQCQTEDDSKHILKHGDILQLGMTTSLLLHIHKGHETCEECEPGQVQAKLKTSCTDKNSHHVVLSKQDKKQQQRKELKNIKKKYGLQNSYFENEGAIPKNPDYTDKAHLRRKFIGSEHHSFQVEEGPASVNSPIAASNKGHALLARMGWREGQGLGKANSGIVEPVNVQLRVNQSSGLGSEEGVSLSLDQVQDTNKVKRWSKARQRFNNTQLCTSTISSHQTNAKSLSSVSDGEKRGFDLSFNVNNASEGSALIKHLVSKPKPTINWHQGSTENLSASQSDDK